MAVGRAMLGGVLQMDIGLVILEGTTLAVIVFGAFAVFSIRRWFVGSNDATPPWLWLRFNVLLFGLCLIALIEGVLLHPYGLFWFVPVIGVTLFVVAKVAPTLLGQQRRSIIRSRVMGSFLLCFIVIASMLAFQSDRAQAQNSQLEGHAGTR
jgi:hypothetical protein